MLQDIEKELGLTREKLIRMALLLGSDYTEGVRCGNYFPYLFWCISVARHAFLSTWRYSNVSFLYPTSNKIFSICPFPAFVAGYQLYAYVYAPC